MDIMDCLCTNGHQGNMSNSNFVKMYCALLSSREQSKLKRISTKSIVMKSNRDWKWYEHLFMSSLYMAKRSGCLKCWIYWIMLLVGRDLGSIISLFLLTTMALLDVSCKLCIVFIMVFIVVYAKALAIGRRMYGQFSESTYKCWKPWD